MAAFDSLLSDPYISNLLSTSSHFRQQQSPMSKMSSVPPASGPVPNLIQFLESVPPHVTLLLVELAPTISWMRWAAEVVSWKSHWTDSWLTLAAWWALCLSTRVILRYLLPLTLLLPATLLYLPFRRKVAHQALPTTEQSITNSLSDLTTLRTLLPTLPVLPSLQFTTALRVSAILYLPYTLTTFFVPMPILLGITGTLLITYRAPWACTIRTVFQRSAYVQRFLIYLWSILSGSASSPVGLTDIQPQPQPTSQVKGLSASAPTSPPIRFLFTILECQRWWMGLDWTAALLPGERPSWCGVSHQPVSPPSVFSLPPPASVFLAAPNGKRVKRTATWRWEESEWGILVNKDGGGAKRVERTPPGLEDEEGGARIATKAAIMLKERTASMGSTNDVTGGKDDSSTTADVGPGVEPERGAELATDMDGWVYGDNKWESTSAKGGMGKYTRYRRWTRIAVLEETVEEVGPGELGVLKISDEAAKPVNGGGPELNPSPDEEEKENRKVSDSPKKGHDRQDSRGSVEEAGSALRERLKSVVKGAKSS